MDADAIVVGGGLAGLVATCELADAGKRVILLDQEPEQSLGGQAFWSFGGLMFVDSPEQRRMRIRDSHDLALQDWMGTAGFDREEDHWPRKWAEAYVGFAAGEKRAWLHAKGLRWFPIVGWAERGGYLATGHGNSVPRFHVTWGTGPAIVAPFVQRVREAAKSGLVTLRFRHRVNALTGSGGVVDGVSGSVLEPSRVERGVRSSRTVTGDFAFKAQAVIVTSGGIGANHDLVRKSWPKRLGEPPVHMLSGVPDYVDGRMLEIVASTGGSIINPDRMWHYTEGITNYAPIWSAHGIRILPGPSSLWIDATGKRLPAPLFPGFDTLGTLAHLRQTGHDYSWFILTQKIIEREFALSGSEQNPDLTGKSILKVLGRRFGVQGPVDAFKKQGVDFIVRSTLPELVAAMNERAGTNLIDGRALEQEIAARDREIDNRFCKDAQVTAIRGARNYLGDKRVEGADVARLNAVALERVNERDLGVLAERIEAGVAHLLDATACRSGSERLSWLAGAQLSVAGVLAHLLSELLVHGFDIARADKRRWPVPPSDAVLAFEVFFVDVFRGIGGSGFVPDDASRSAEFACEFRARGAEPVVFAYENGELGIQAPGRPVDVRVWGDPAALLLVMFGRVNPAGSLLRGKIVIAGRRPWRLRRLMRLAP